jgi:hypothetical protein
MPQQVSATKGSAAAQRNNKCTAAALLLLLLPLPLQGARRSDRVVQFNVQFMRVDLLVDGGGARGGGAGGASHGQSMPLHNVYQQDRLGMTGTVASTLCTLTQTSRCRLLPCNQRGCCGGIPKPVRLPRPICTTCGLNTAGPNVLMGRGG